MTSFLHEFLNGLFDSVCGFRRIFHLGARRSFIDLILAATRSSSRDCLSTTSNESLSTSSKTVNANTIEPSQVSTSSSLPSVTKDHSKRVKLPLTSLGLRRLKNRLALERPLKPEASQKRDRRPDALITIVRCVLLNLICIVLLIVVVFPFITFCADRISYVVTLLAWKRESTVKSAAPVFLYLSLFLKNFLQTLWILPVFTLSRLINALWFQDIANAVFKISGRRTVPVAFSRTLADFFYSTLLETIFLIQIFFVGLLPLPPFNAVAQFVHYSLLYSLYSFEYVWMSRGVKMNQRLTWIQTQWPYYLGFGCWLAAVSRFFFPDVFVSSCVFGLSFPFLIISAFEVDLRRERSGQLERLMLHGNEQDEFIPCSSETFPTTDNKMQDFGFLPIFAPSARITDILAQTALKKALG